MMNEISAPQSLLIISHVVHYEFGEHLYASAPYAREIEMWADLFPQVVIAAPYQMAPPTGDAIPFIHTNIVVLPLPETGGYTLTAKLYQLAMLPIIIYRLSRAMARVEALHVRCPGNVGLVGACLGPLFARYRIAKYAGQWSDYPGEARTVRFQKWILRSWWWRAPVTVYGEWPGQPAHIISFFTSVMGAEQMVRAEAAARQKRLSRRPLRVLFVGRLSASKNVHILLSALARLNAEAMPLEGVIVGDGPERAALEAQAAELGLRAQVNFAGSVDFEGVLDFYEAADILVLASETEGWPKAIAEGMAFGLVCVGSERGLIPWMLGEGRGLLVPPGSVDALAEALRQIALQPAAYLSMSRRAAAWSSQYSLEGLRDALRELLSREWGVLL
jgi:glycosyltransferase involved in cell wall biosynthesis